MIRQRDDTPDLRLEVGAPEGAPEPTKARAPKVGPPSGHPYEGHQANPNAVRRVDGEVVDYIEPLYPHVSEETAYVQDGYPMGRQKRAQRRTWVEFKPKKGFRFAAQTQNIRRGVGWNKPKKSTYSMFANIMYLDTRDDHIKQMVLHEYNADPERVSAFIDAFPDMPPGQRFILREWAAAKAAYTAAVVKQNEQGFTGMSIAGKPVPVREGDMERNKANLAEWKEILARLDGGSGSEEGRTSRENPRRRHRNPARASRGEQYQSATLTDGHFDTATVKVATKIAQKARKKGQKLGRGNFGEVYGIDGHVVKFPVLDGYNRQKTPEQARGYLLHEAGVANELAEDGHRVVPVTVFVELADGTPALVREYGKSLSKVTTDEVAALEKGLYDVEATGKQGWDVADELLVMRRKDGTLFVADVGWWRVRKKARKHNYEDRSDVPGLLSHWAKSVGLPTNIQKALDIDFNYKIGRVYALMEDMKDAEDEDDLFVVLLAEDEVPEMQAVVDARTALGLPVPSAATKAIKDARAALAAFGVSA